MIDKTGYEQVYSNNPKYNLYRKIENDKGKWIAEDVKTGEVFPITYEQARGYEPIRPTETDKLARELGKLLMPETN